MRFYFDTLNGGRCRDSEGQELSSLEEVQDEAVQALVDMGKDELAHIKSGRVSVKVRDDSGKTVLTASLILNIERRQ
jgi:hypothetical protein